MTERLAAGIYVEGVRELMAAYNESGDDEIYRVLRELAYAPNEAALRENYAANATAYAARYETPVLPSYDELPVLLFPVTDAYSVLYDRDARRFLLDGSMGLFALLQVLLFCDAAEIPAAATRFQRDLDDVRALALA